VRRAIRGAASAGALVAAVASSGTALAESPRALVVVWAEGPDKDAAREKATSGLSDATLVDTGAWQGALAQQGHRGPVAPALRDPKKRAHLFEQMREAAKSLHVDEVVLLVNARTAHGRDTTMLVVDPASSDAPAETHLAGGKGGDDVAHAVQEAVAKVHAKAAPSSASPSAADSDATTDGAARADGAAPDAESDRASTAGRPRRHEVGENLFDIAVGIEGGARHFDYNDGRSTNLRPYRLDGAPLVAAAAEVYPLAGAYAVDVGLVLGYARAFALQSSTSDVGTLSTQWSRYDVGAHLRLRTGKERSPIVGLTGAYGDESFVLQGSTGAAANAALPSVDYRFVKASADVRVPFGRAAAFADLGYLFVLSAGDVATRFPKATAGGVDAELGGAFELASGLEARITGRYRRFFYAMNPTPGDGYVAGGALDQLFGVQAALAYVY
jgi:hypothetical protein